mmetsp:Transcript_11485/g.16856  ORF Transcript_11485/g.16856 Transcript_11485/m.16856 type:complete len:108 (+) Transcript_11485:958-1281(+)
MTLAVTDLTTSGLASSASLYAVQASVITSGPTTCRAFGAFVLVLNGRSAWWVLIHDDDDDDVGNGEKDSEPGAHNRTVTKARAAEQVLYTILVILLVILLSWCVFVR